MPPECNGLWRCQAGLGGFLVICPQNHEIENTLNKRPIYLILFDGGWDRNRTGVHGFAGRCASLLINNLQTMPPELPPQIDCWVTKYLKT